MLFCSHCSQPLAHDEKPDLPEPGVIVCAQCQSSTRPTTQPIWRVDSKHFEPSQSRNSNETETNPESSTSRISRDSGIASRPITSGLKSNRFSILFGLTVFLGGQTLILGGFIAVNFSAWIVGTLVSVAGSLLALLSTMDAIKKIESRFSALPGQPEPLGNSSPVSRPNALKKSRRNSPRPN